jgi:hypothetical protein
MVAMSGKVKRAVLIELTQDRSKLPHHKDLTTPK